MFVRKFIIAAPLALAAFAAPAMAASDYSTTTCAEWNSMDAATRAEVSSYFDVKMKVDGMTAEEVAAWEAEMGDKLANMSDRDRYNARYKAIEEAETNRVSTLSDAARADEEKLHQASMESRNAGCDGNDEAKMIDIETNRGGTK